MNMHVKAASKFKVGDRVRLLDDNSMAAKPGATATVVGHNEPYIKIKWDRNWQSNSQMDGNYYPSSFELAPLFAVGDKVRSISTPEAGVGTIEAVKPEGGYRVNFKNTWFAVCHGDDADLAPTYTSCAAAEVDNLADEYGGGRKFKVGDRVRAVDGTALLEIGREYVATDADDKNVWVDVRDGNMTHNFNYPYRYFEHVAVAPATALTIQAGKFYKTRDGRKVGPMVYHGGDKWPFGGSNGLTYTASGQFASDFREHRNDLIAEWPSDDVPLRGVSPVAKTVVAPATTAKFKVGDRVVDVSTSAPNGTGKSFATINGVGRDTVKVIWEKDGAGGYYDWPAIDFELASPAPTTSADIVRKHSGTAIVCLLENGQPKPSTEPFVHTSRSAATTEASRLAGIHKGKEFGVYVCVDVKKVERTFDHEWQRLAARGSKIPAIKAYRDVGGNRRLVAAAEWGFPARYEDRHVIGLKEAKDAVEHWLATAA